MTNWPNFVTIDSHRPSDASRKLYHAASAIAIGGNLVLIGIKAVAAVISSSSAIYADAANSASDVVYSLFMALGLTLSLRPPDSGHPHGHQRAESLVGVVIAMAMGIAGYAAAHEGIAAFSSPVPTMSVWAIVVLLATAVIKTAMYIGSRRLAREAHSSTLHAAAVDNLSDIITSSAALAGYLASQYIWPQLDGIAALAVSAWIFKNAIQIAIENLGHLVGSGVSEETLESMAEIVLQIPGVVAVERLVAEHAGPRVILDVHILAAGDMPLREVHALSHRVRKALEQCEIVEHAWVHVEPTDMPLDASY